MKKFITIAAAIAALAATSTINTTAYAADTPAISVSIVGDTIISGDSAKYTIIYEGDVSLITISEDSIGLEGFTANKSVYVTDNTAMLTLTNIVDLEGNNTIRVAGGTALTKDKIMAEEATLEDIVIGNNSNPNTGATIPVISALISSFFAIVSRKRK